MLARKLIEMKANVFAVKRAFTYLDVHFAFSLFHIYSYCMQRVRAFSFTTHNIFWKGCPGLDFNRCAS